MGVFNTGLFSKPRFSAFPWAHSNRISMNAGVLTPIATEYLNQGDKIDSVDMSAVIRNAPMVAPTLDTYRVDMHAFAVRLRSIGHAKRDPWKYEDFFNLNVNKTGDKRLSSVPLGCILAVNGLKTGTLFESLGFPTFKTDREAYLEWLRNHHPYIWDPVTQLFNYGDDSATYLCPSTVPFIGSSDGVPYFISSYYSTLVSTGHFLPSYSFNSLSFNYQAAGSIVLPFNSTLINFVALKYPAVFGEQLILNSDMCWYCSVARSRFSTTPLPFIRSLDGMNVLDRVYELYKVDSVSVLKEFEDFLLDGFLKLRTYSDFPGDLDYRAIYYNENGPFTYDSIFEQLRQSFMVGYPDAEKTTVISVSGTPPIRVYDIEVPTYYFEAYWKVISDWYINTAIDNPDTFFRTVCDTPTLRTHWCDILIEVNKLFSRLWANDYFTSAFPSPQAGDAVGIPINGTIVDLRNANAMQKLKERLLYAGSRFRDVMYAITGKRTSAAILEMSEVIASCSTVINVDSVLQQSRTENGAPLADYGGTGLGYRSGSKPFSYTAEEPTVIIILASIVPQASYFQGLHRKFMRQSVYDYAVPQLANVGEQKVYLGELYLSGELADSDRFDPAVDGTFGYQRRNGDFMWTPNEVHGDFQTSLDFWHNARIFGSKPSLSREFLAIKPKDDNLNRIWAVKSDSVNHFYARFDFGGQVIRSLPKHVHYDL